MADHVPGTEDPLRERFDIRRAVRTPGHVRRLERKSYRDDVLVRVHCQGLGLPSRCQGWSRGDLLFHMLLDAQRALVAFATPAPGEPDVDFVSYWAPFRPGAEGYAAHARFVRRVASSYQSDLVIA